jgi:ABC-type transport system involved in multi-copper enzyme maturation permease subunit
MIWLTWRQLRKQTMYTALALIALAALMLPTGLAMHHSFTSSGLADCIAKIGTSQLISGRTDNCTTLREQFSNQYNGMTFIGILFVVLPVFVGIFFGAPLVAREVEHGYHRLVWTQGVSRRQWAWTKFGVIGAVTLALAVAYALGMSWWFAPLVANGGGRLSPVSFDVQGIAPIGYTLFAVALGVFAGAVSHRVLPAMGITLGGFLAVRVLVETLARPRYLTPETLSVPLTSPAQFNPFGNDWIYSQGVINAAGRLVMPNSQIGCAIDQTREASPDQAIAACGSELIQQGLGPAPFANWMRYQPDSRFWAFQGIETGVFLVLTALLLYLAVRSIRRIA